ncbi:Integral peroxisomal membrane peroxin [Rasamsonia emersonii CBS 393.64]|uniref:Integral peroxisomal membrane peroxin n=1 Tax=Rasamsonia emersonii (strain ATCC 16479 / CBS 393.64 / IMI 116815) TaxID=1408163 RepID=A0A0F4Z2S6_RASE3|nr:Integral peroxisomal membrane peroxin [Rasamsonia emersonii CBS 393.64]KKA24396.1 Integral peroxisomal membrane peroxin [Rasamsonia emersonii CBS 393.64]
MDEYTVDAFANRDDSIPLTSIPADNNAQDEPSSPSDSTKEKLPANEHTDGSYDGSDGSRRRSILSFQDRLFAKLLQQVIPKDEDENDEQEEPADRQSKRASRPPFSLPVMANNFRRFNARIGIAFVFQNRLIRLFSWRYPTQTLSFLAVYSFVCLDPSLLPVVPLATILLFIMVPAFLARHPPPPSNSTSGTTPYYSYNGPALAPAPTIKPASETSKDFLRNMRDLQNSMADFANLHDALVALLSPPTNFSDETLSSTLFLFLFIITAALFLTSHLLPWRFIFLIGGNAAVIAGHPAVQEFLSQVMGQEPKKADPTSPKSPSKAKPAVPASLSSVGSFLGSLANISLDAYPEEREVEIFELQYRSLSPYATSSAWETVLFSPTPYDPLSPSRIAGDRPRGCRFFEDVQPPPGWAWKGKKWELDLECREWVMERMITGVGFEVPPGSSDDEGGSAAMNEEVGGWVWDLPPSSTSQAGLDDDEFRQMAYGDLNLRESRSKAAADQKGKGKTKGNRNSQGRDWEESTGGAQTQGMGEWRRRRWVRMVHRHYPNNYTVFLF